MARTVILVHGFWLGSWVWEEVAADIENAGYRVLAPTLPGNGRGASRRGVGLEEHVQFLTDMIDHEADEVVLVGHSAGGAPVHAAVDRRPDRIAHAVYVDTRPLPDGQPLNPTLPADGDDVPRRAWEDCPPGWLDGLDQEVLDRFARLSTPSPTGAARDPQRLSDPRRYTVPITEVATTQTARQMQARAAAGDPLFTELRLIQQVEWVDLPTGHYPMLSRPHDLARIILRTAAA